LPRVCQKRKKEKKKDKKGPPRLFGRVLIRQSVSEERGELKRIIAFKYFDFIFIYFLSQTLIFLQYFTLLDCCWCVVELNNSECTGIS